MPPLLASALLAPALLLSGCGGNVSFPDTVMPGTAQVTPLGTIQGSVYGGHAPLVSAHVYVLEPQASGYGGQAKSLLTAGGTSPYVNTLGPPRHSHPLRVFTVALDLSPRMP